MAAAAAAAAARDSLHRSFLSLARYDEGTSTLKAARYGTVTVTTSYLSARRRLRFVRIGPDLDRDLTNPLGSMTKVLAHKGNHAFSYASPAFSLIADTPTAKTRAFTTAYSTRSWERALLVPRRRVPDLLSPVQLIISNLFTCPTSTTHLDHCSSDDMQ